MAEQSYFMGQDGFIWFVGVVEDRNDPERIGRVRVRCLGFHTEDLNLLPTIDLPWAHVMHPVTDPSMHGMGNTPSFLVEGSWVIGFFRDAQEKQQPVIIGSLPGTPSEGANPRKGFNDPRSGSQNLNGDPIAQEHYIGTPQYGPYPTTLEMPSGHEIMEPDTNRLAQGAASETHTSLINRRLQRLRGDPTKVDTTIGVDDNADTTLAALTGKNIGTGIPTAVQPYIPSVSPGSAFGDPETRGWWDEPDPKSIKKYAATYISGQYPYNHVHESESGHIHEIDDSPGAERLFTQHTSGTFEEIHPTGTKVVKVIGDNYEIIAGDSNISITGDVNITIEGTVRELVKGDYHLEVEGNYSQKIHKNHRVKIGVAESGGNREEEIMGSHSYNIQQNVKGRVGEDVDTIIEGSETRIVNGIQGSKLNVVNDITAITLANMKLGAKTNMTASTTSGIVTVSSGDKLNIKSATAMNVKTEAAGLTIYSEGLVTETFKASHTSDVTGTLDLNVSTEVDIDSAIINLN